MLDSLDSEESASGEKDTGSETEGERGIHKGFARENVEVLIVAIIFVLFVKTFLFQSFRIPSSSMENTLLVGDRLMVNKFVYGAPTGTWLDRFFPIREIRRGDVVIFRWPVDPEKDFVKRFIGLPGEVVEIREKTVYIDHQPLQEPYKLLKLGLAPLRSASFAALSLPEGKYLALGDNRDESSDSRSWGLVPRGLVRGKAFMIWWSYDEKHEWEETEGASWLSRVKTTVLDFLAGMRWHRFFKRVR
jgi:signal peptidase I